MQAIHNAIKINSSSRAISTPLMKAGLFSALGVRKKGWLDVNKALNTAQAMVCVNAIPASAAAIR